MVPVLSSSNTSTSPAASTARPEVAITFAPSMRLMPAMPMAESSAPMVVGIKHTSSATSAVSVTGWPALAASTLKSEYGSSVTVASRKIRVSATSRMVSAISFGVFWRFAPSTRAIMRSIKASPGLTVMRTTIQSDSTVVPPVTAEKSPPASRMTGADSPVIAASLTEAAPSMTSPSAGIMSPASTSTTWPRPSSVPGSRSTVAPWRGSRSFLATTNFLAAAQRRGLGSAPALGQRLGEIGEQHREPQPQRGDANEPRRCFALTTERLHPQPGGEQAADEDDEHHRVLELNPRVQLAKGADQGRRDQASDRTWRVSLSP